MAIHKSKLIRLFQEFISSYLYTADGLSQKAAYEKQRQQREHPLHAIASESAETEPILLQLFPDTDLQLTDVNQVISLHIPASRDRKRELLAQRTNFDVCALKIIQTVGKNLVNFLHRCQNYPHQLSAACIKFYHKPYSQSFDIPEIAPILNGLQPDRFLAIDRQSLQVINYFCHEDYTDRLTDYPAVNQLGKQLIAELAEEMHQPGVPALKDGDLFDLFCHWLVDVKKYNLVAQLTQLNSPRLPFERGEHGIPFFPREVGEDSVSVEQVKEVELQPEYPLAAWADETGLTVSELERWVRAIERKKQAILSGTPGTGKTFIAQKMAQHLIGSGDGFSELVQFHPAYSYEDFIQGIRPQTQAGQLSYPLVPGRFLEFCDRAKYRSGRCVMIIDEINRANISQVFGELMYLLEYRDRTIPLAGSKEPFAIPANVRLIGTMNTADRSIALVDYALRRRFAFIELRPNYQVLRRYHTNTGFPVDGLIAILEQLNQAIADKHYELGISFFLTDNLAQELPDIWLLEIEPYLEEYFFDRMEQVNEFRWDNIQQKIFSRNG